MGRALEAIRTRDLARLFPFFGLEAERDVVDAYRSVIADRFALEVQAIERFCSNLRERERFQLLREALRLAYEGALRRARPAGT